VSSSADWILLNGRVQRFTDDAEPATALAVRGQRILAVGSSDEVESTRGARTITTDLAGAAVLPGFCDTHMHFQKIARELNMVHLDGVQRLGDVIGAVHVAAETAPAGEWIRSFGDTESWHERDLDEGRLPTRAELDEAAPLNPVFLYRRPDRAVLNTAAVHGLAEKLQALPVDAFDESSGLVGGSHVRMLNDFLHRDGAPSRERELQLLANASTKLLKMGITSIVDPGLAAAFAESWETYSEARGRRLVAQRLHLMNRVDYRRPLAEELDRFLSSPALPLEGDEFLRAWALKIFLDGEFEDGWMRPDEQDGGKPIQRYAVHEVEQIVDLCAARGWPLCMHVMGGAAIECAISAVRGAALQGASFFPGQISLAHAFLARRDDVVACRELGISISVQPMLAHLYDAEMEKAWGPEQSERANPFATMCEVGAIVAGGSDTLPCEPLRGVYAAVTRRTVAGIVRGVGEALTPAQALSLFTRAGGAYVGKNDQGSLAPEQVADFVVWPEDPLETAPERWGALEPRLVAIGGSPVWTAEGDRLIDAEIPDAI
jgi:predicted amidohydrolase YtcJ